jgi:hypothetical protein
MGERAPYCRRRRSVPRPKRSLGPSCSRYALTKLLCGVCHCATLLRIGRRCGIARGRWRGSVWGKHHHATKETSISWIVTPLTSGDRLGQRVPATAVPVGKYASNLLPLPGRCLFLFEQVVNKSDCDTFSSLRPSDGCVFSTVAR